MGESLAHALPGSESLLTAAWFESMADAMLLCDRSLVVCAANRAASRLLQMTPGELLHRKANEVLAPAVAAGPLPAQPPPARLAWTCEFQAPEGERHTLEISGVVLKDKVTGIEGWALSLHRLGAAEAPPEFIGESAAAQELMEFVSRIAASRATSILLVGESGTGKEVIARRLHALSQRASAPLVPINCAALPENLLESELFGYEKGAFTGASDAKKGLFEIADRGTVFLDEIGEMPLALQAKLLRVLEDQTFRRVGGSLNVSVNVRVIGATNADLESAIHQRRFRGDLFYRLNGVQIRVPALRERLEDLPGLVSYFLDYFNRVHGRAIRGVDAGAKRMLERHSWPGNIRELRNVIERAVLVEESPWLTIPNLGLPSSGGAARRLPEKAEAPGRFSLVSGEKDLIVAALAEAGNNQTRAAELLGIGRFSLRYKMKKLGML